MGGPFTGPPASITTPGRLGEAALVREDHVRGRRYASHRAAADHMRSGINTLKGDFVTELELTRTSNDRRLYSLEGVGTVRLEGLFSSSATAEAGGESVHLAHRGLWQRAIEARDAAGTVVGEFLPRDIRRGGTLRWRGRELTLRPLSPLRERYALGEGDRELALLDGKGWGRRPVAVSIAEADDVEPQLLLFAAFVVHRLAAKAGESAGGTAAAMSGASSGS